MAERKKIKCPCCGKTFFVCDDDNTDDKLNPNIILSGPLKEFIPSLSPTQCTSLYNYGRAEAIYDYTGYHCE